MSTLALGCGDEEPTLPPAPDATVEDARVVDADPPMDGMVPDASPGDSSAGDSSAGDSSAGDSSIVDASRPDARPGSCGAMGRCGPREFCDYRMEFMCGGPATCRPRPEACAEIFDPVCGCDGRDYSNVCDANSQGTDAASRGMCP